MSKIRVTIWNENRHEQEIPAIAAIYPKGIHGQLAEALAAEDLEIRTATLDQPEHWGYVFESVEAEPSFTYQRTQLCFHGHTHVPTVFEQQGFGEVRRHSPEDFSLVLGRKYFVNTGSVGQPRDSDPRASYCLYEPARRAVTFRRLDYDISAAQARVLEAGLPEHLARRLGSGRCIPRGERIHEPNP